ncbi:hypothetical protein [Tenacibaculum sp. 190524A02b]|uniref:hypothetical protein n=1 Tax=Tenacibaculum vairaonense TaxID=3137860 RepID=UPI0031FB3C13
MGLSYKSVKKAYKVFHEVKELHPITIESFPDDMANWKDEEKENPPLDIVLGWNKKYDGGWESISFFVKDPSKELIEKFNELKEAVPNTSICNPYYRNESIWCFGWF